MDENKRKSLDEIRALVIRDAVDDLEMNDLQLAQVARYAFSVRFFKVFAELTLATLSSEYIIGELTRQVREITFKKEILN